MKKKLYKKRSKSCLKNKSLSFEKSGQKTGQSQKPCRTTHARPKIKTCPGKSGRMDTLIIPKNICKNTRVEETNNQCNTPHEDDIDM